MTLENYLQLKNGSDVRGVACEGIAGQPVTLTEEAAENIAKAFDKIHTWNKPEFAKTWLTRILINECYSILNRKKRVISIHEVEDSLSTENKADYSELYEALMTLPTDIRVAIILYYMEGYKIKEIAKEKRNDIRKNHVIMQP